VILDGMRVLRLCSVFEPAAVSERSAGYDAIGGMQNHAAELSRHLDRMGARQLILTSRLDGPAVRTGFGRQGQIVRTGVDTRLARQGWALLAARLALGGTPVDVVHGHCGEDIAVLPLARLAARRHHCPLVITVHASVRHNLRVASARTAWLRLAGGLAERRALAAADMVIALTPAAADRLAGEGIPRSRIRVIPPGYDLDLFAADAPDPFPDLGRPRVGYIGRIARRRTSAR
jgi:glycogen(starch) synthase